MEIIPRKPRFILKTKEMRFLIFSLLLALTACPVLADVKEAKAAADQHYAHAKAGDEAAWAATFNKEDFELYKSAKENGTKGHVLESPWRSAQRKVAREVTWKYLRTDKDSAEECKFFYERVLPNGKRDGFAVPIRLKMEDGKWVVESAAY